MKRTVLVLFAVLSASTSNAQLIKLKNVQSVKEGKIIVVLTKNEEVNTWLKEAVKTYWTFCDVAGYTDLEDAKKQAKADKNLFVLNFKDAFVPSPSHTMYTGTSVKQSTNAASGTTDITRTKHYVRYRNITMGQYIEVNSIREFIPSFEEGECTQEIIFYSIRILQHIMKTMDEHNLQSNMKIYSAFKDDTPLLKERILYLPEEWIAPGLDSLEIAKLYEGKIKVVTYETWSNAIINSQEGIAYCMIVPRPTGNGYVYMHYIVDCKTAKILAIAYPKVAVSFGTQNISSSNTGYIDKKNLEMYNNALSGSW
jgi:hypothetical protein